MLLLSLTPQYASSTWSWNITQQNSSATGSYTQAVPVKPIPKEGNAVRNALSLPHTAREFSNAAESCPSHFQTPSQEHRIRVRTPVLTKQGKPKLIGFSNLTLSYQSFSQ